MVMRKKSIRLKSGLEIFWYYFQRRMNTPSWVDRGSVWDYFCFYFFLIEKFDRRYLFKKIGKMFFIVKRVKSTYYRAPEMPLST